MKDWVIPLLRCPICKSTLTLTEFERSNEETIGGTLQCDSCSAWYPILRGIPRMLPPHLRVAIDHEFKHRYRESLGSIKFINQQTTQQDDQLAALKSHTIQNFGFEWIEYARFGWDDPVYSIEKEEQVFLRKTLLAPDELAGKLALDAGCGNGRYSYWAAQHGARVIGFDLGDGVESAAKNTAGIDTVQILQGDIFNPPFPDRRFDIIFSIGVLMHTGDAQRATLSLADKVKPGGSLSIHLYGRGNPIYEFVDHRLRRWTTSLSIDELQQFTRRLYKLRRALARVRLAGQLGRFVRIDPHPHCIFDWYAAPIATHHTLTEVRPWFEQAGFKIIANRARQLPPTGLQRWLYRPGTVTVRAQADKIVRQEPAT